ncbi:MAG: alpha/beta fold hydrolase [Rectinemataceae bacterium]
MNVGGSVDPGMLPWPALAPLARTVASSAAAAGEESRLFYFDSAPEGRDGPHSIMLIHGLGDEADSFRHLFPLLGPEYRLIALDLPGFGRSLTNKPTTLAGCSQAVRAVAAHAGASRLILVGSSLGAAIAQLVASEAPELAAGLVLLDGGMPVRSKPSGALLAMALPLIGEGRYRAFRRDHGAALRSLHPYYADFAALSQADRDFLASRVVARVESEGQLRAYFSLLRDTILRAGKLEKRFLAVLADAGRPRAIVWGEADLIVPLEAGRELARLTGGDVQLQVTPGAGHLPHQEKAGAIARVIRNVSAACQAT